MKKALLLLCVLIFSVSAYAQTTYYWINDAAGTAHWNEPSNWSTAADGSGGPRSIPQSDDVLVFDGTNFANKTIRLHSMPEQVIGALHITGGITVTIEGVDGWPAAVTDALTAVVYGESTYSITGTDNTFNTLKAGDVLTTNSSIKNPMNYVQVLAIQDDAHMTVSKEQSSGTFSGASSYYKVKTLYTDYLDIDAGSVLRLGGAGSGTDFISYVVNTKGGIVKGSVVFASRGGHCKLVCTTRNDSGPAAGLRFKNGADCTVNTSTSSKQNYNLGATLGEYASGKFIFKDASGNNNQIPGYDGAAGIVFEEGSTFLLGTGDNLPPFGPSINSQNDLVFTPAAAFKKGSNYIHQLGRTGMPYFYTGEHAFYPNLEIAAGYPGNLSLGRVENLTISGGVNADVVSNSGTIFVAGNISNTTSYKINFGNAIIYNPANSKIGGAGQGLIDFTALIIADKSVVSLAQNITAADVHVLGSLNFGPYTISGTGTFAAYGNYSKTAVTDFITGSNVIGGVNQTGKGTAGYEYPIGAMVSNASYLPEGTIYRAYNSSGNGRMTSYAIGTASGETAVFSIEGSSYSADGNNLTASAPGFSTYLIDDITLPLELLSFSGKLFGNHVSLDWKTANEINVNFFAIERRSETASDFEEIGRVNAENLAGNTYSFTDKANSNSSRLYYRLKTVDTDGSFKYSDVIVIKSDLISITLALKAYPNPAVDQVNLVHPAANPASRIVVFSNTGKTVLLPLIKAESTETSIDLSDLGPGIYHILYQDNRFKSSLKVVKTQ